MPESDLDLLIGAARQAGEIALHHKAKGLEVEHKPNDAGPVTQADIAVDRALREALTSARPDYGWLSEETRDTPERLDRRKLFIVDPIDGTRSFVNGETTWAHSLAVVEDGVVTQGVVYLPEMDLLYSAATSQGALCNGNQLSVSDISDIHTARILATKPNMEQEHWRKAVPGFARAHRPSLAYRLCLVAQGRYDAMLTFRPSWEWDIAAGALILSEAGATVTDRHGAALRFNNAVPQTAGVVGAGAVLHAQIAENLVYTA
ncbi:3'(2'),5'-bisphosphate nucleotidase CysQ [Marivita sp. XM-24bin2]|uniref:3'(2'),5'-bisphosphate nucleotidase CysQ n=1 Tax=unclassified Marivita TaxID=2632480 RepID=UPI000D7A76DE|nr:3'(2'),5'-bisphosphate nucleotidase CysQ [Marivita sp. XM-24bin2]MCR9110462.1 3'(2'),5'-bisphosphate nucleotidase CysQ [Paracoccaceae bacterium]PWL36835.1 MAG: 3'(2'),5'-bisphosphate nucleotidase CysQ [Marivita sp. XM-24bin2]